MSTSSPSAYAFLSSPSPAFFLSFFQDLLSLLHLINYFPIPKCNPQPQPAASWPKCPLFSQQQVIPAWWEAAQTPWQELLPCLEAAHGLYFSCRLYFRTFCGQICPWCGSKLLIYLHVSHRKTGVHRSKVQLDGVEPAALLPVAME